MTNYKVISFILCAVLLLSVTAPKPVRADSGDRDDGRPIRLFATAYPGPIGSITDNLVKDGLAINGRVVSGGQSIWSGDLIQSGRGSRVSVSLDSIGRVTLSRGTAVRLATRPVTFDDGAKGSTLIAKLEQGEIAVSLEGTATAYLRAAGSAYTSSGGAVFRASVRGGNASVSVRFGEVVAEPQSSQHQYSIRPVDHGSNITVPVRGLTRVQVQVLEDDKPVSGVGVLFVLDTSGTLPGSLGIGTLASTNLSVVTNANGIAALHFVAGETAGTVPIVATVEGTRVSWSGVITVKSKGVSKGTGWIIAVFLGAGAAAGIAYALSRENQGPLQAEPPVVKNP